MINKTELEKILFRQSDNDEPIWLEPTEKDINAIVAKIPSAHTEQAIWALKNTHIWNWHTSLGNNKRQFSPDQKARLKALKNKCDGLLKEIDKHIFEDTIGVFDADALEHTAKSVTQLSELTRQYSSNKKTFDGYREFVYYAALLFQYITNTPFTSANERNATNYGLNSTGEKFIQQMTKAIFRMKQAHDCEEATAYSDYFKTPFAEPEKAEILATRIKTACLKARARLNGCGQ